MSNFKFLRLLKVTSGILGSVKVAGYLSDKFAIKTDRLMYLRKRNKVIYGIEDIYHTNNNKELVFFVHGFNSNPQANKDLLSKFDKSKFDIYCPLLPYHGRDVDSLDKIDFEEIENFVLFRLRKIDDDYRKVHIIGFSMGATIVMNLLSLNKFSNRKYKVSLISPAIMVKMNTDFYKGMLKAKSLFSKYIRSKFRTKSTSLAARFNQSNFLLFYSINSILSYFSYESSVVKNFYDNGKSFNVYLGDSDKFVKINSIKKFFSGISSAKTNVYDLGKHFFAYEEDSDIVDKLSK